MEYTESNINDFITGTVREALSDAKPELSVPRYAQGRFVKGDPASVTCTWQLSGGRSRAFEVTFSGNALAALVTLGDEKFAKFRADAIRIIQAKYKEFDPADTGSKYAFLVLIDDYNT